MHLAWERFSSVAVGLTLRSPLLHHVTENHFDTAWQAMQQFLERGYRRVGFVFSEDNDSPRVGDRWLSAFLGQQQRWPEEDRVPPCPAIPAGEAAFAAWFRQEKPDAILTNHCRPVLAWLRRLGKEVPRDVGLVELECHPELRCSGVYYDPAKIAALAVEMIVGLMHRNETGVPPDVHEVLLKGSWWEGSTLPPRKGRAPAAS